MDKIMEKLNKLSLPSVILIASIILGGFIYTSQLSKQKSIERQQEIKIEQEKQNQLVKELKEKQIKEQSEQALNTCIADTEREYNDTIEGIIQAINEGKFKGISVDKEFFDDFKVELQNNKTECFKKYPQK